MVRFFRKIRKRLLIHSKFGKYMLYAVGEVLILIIGIFFALQADNWNEKRQNRIIEISILKAIKTELAQDLVAIKIEDLPILKEVIVSSDIIVNYLKQDLPYNDSLAYHFLASNYTTHLIYNNGAISTLRSVGVNIITNEQLRNEIINLFDVKFAFMDYMGNEHDNYCTHGKNFILNSRFDQVNYYDDPTTDKEYDGKMIPLDFERLKKDSEYLFHIKSYKNLTSYYLQSYLDTESAISQVISNIEEEINTLEQ